MIESAAYEIIKKEGFEEGLKQGLQQGLQQGLLEEAREMVLEALEERFGIVPSSIITKIRGLREREHLKVLHRAAIRAKSLEEFVEVLKQVET